MTSAETLDAYMNLSDLQVVVPFVGLQRQPVGYRHKLRASLCFT